MTRPHAYTALAVLSLLAAGCSKAAQTTTTTATTAVPPASRAINVTVAQPQAAPVPPPLATGPGVTGETGDTAKTAAVTAPANSNGTIPPHGVDPPPSR